MEMDPLTRVYFQNYIFQQNTLRILDYLIIL